MNLLDSPPPATGRFLKPINPAHDVLFLSWNEGTLNLKDSFD
jgi:hypothetical protein